MTGAFIILGVTVLVGLILYLTRGKADTPAIEGNDTPAPQSQEETESPEVCCGRHAVCEKGLLTAEELYYNDEELDRYIGREPDDYTPDEVEEFRDVLYTLRPDEVYSWGMALTQRNIPLPLPLRDEWIMICEK